MRLAIMRKSGRPEFRGNPTSSQKRLAKKMDPRVKPIGAKIRCDVSRMRCSASDSEAVHRWSGTVAKAVCV